MSTKEYQQAKSDDSALQKGKQAGLQNNADGKRVTTITPDNDNGDPGAPSQQNSSNKGQGPKGENL